MTLGRALIELNQLDEAQVELSRVLESAPENLAAIRGLAEIHHRHGDLAAGADAVPRRPAARPQRPGSGGDDRRLVAAGRAVEAGPDQRPDAPAHAGRAAEAGAEEKPKRAPGPISRGRCSALRSPVRKTGSSGDRFGEMTPDPISENQGDRLRGQWDADRESLTTARRGRSPRSSSGSPPSMSHAQTDTLRRRHQAVRADARRTAPRCARRHVAAEHSVPDELHRQLGDRGADRRSARVADRFSLRHRDPGIAAGMRRTRADDRRGLVRRARSCSVSRHCLGPAARVGHRGRSPDGGPPSLDRRRRWLGPRRPSKTRHARRRPKGLSSARVIRKDHYEIATLREAARRLSTVAADVLTDVRAGHDGAGTGAGHRLAHSTGRLQPVRRSTRLSPADPTRRCLTRTPASEVERR